MLCMAPLILALRITDYLYTVKHVLSVHPLLSGQYPKSPSLFPLFTLNETFIKRTPLLSGRENLKST